MYKWIGYSSSWLGGLVVWYNTNHSPFPSIEPFFFFQPKLATSTSHLKIECLHLSHQKHLGCLRREVTTPEMTNLGPLLSKFAPAASCASYTGMTVFYVGTTNFFWAEGPMSTQGCYPSSYSPGPADYYSPGLCPSGYTSACTSLNSIGTVTETIHTCCPTWVCFPAS